MPDAKSHLRQELRRLRRAYPESERAREEAATVAALAEWLQAGQPFASYMAMPGELSLAQLHEQWWQAGTPVWLPRVVGDGVMQWALIAGADELRPGAYDILEPAADADLKEQLPQEVVCLVPGVAYGPHGVRLGQGGGFYDRFLTGLRTSVGVGLSCQWHDGIPTEAHDQRVTRVLCGGEWRL